MMNKKIYKQPAMRAVVMQKHSSILTGSPVTEVQTDVDINPEITGGSEPGRARTSGDWDDEWDE